MAGHCAICNGKLGDPVLAAPQGLLASARAEGIPLPDGDICFSCLNKFKDEFKKRGSAVKNTGHNALTKKSTGLGEGLAALVLLAFLFWGLRSCGLGPKTEEEKRADACKAAVEVMQSRHTDQAAKLNSALYYEQYCKK